MSYPSTYPFLYGVDDTKGARYAKQLADLFPRGRLWNFGRGSVLSRVLLALADEFARIETRAEDLMLEADPRTATETLGDWEKMLGITPASYEEADRRTAITAKYAAQGGGTAAYLEALLTAQGIAAVISLYKVCKSGTFRSGDPCYGSARAFAFKVSLPTATPNHAQIESTLRDAAPAHTVLVFSYT